MTEGLLLGKENFHPLPDSLKDLEELKSANM